MRSFAGTSGGRMVSALVLVAIAWAPISLFFFHFTDLPTTIDRSQDSSAGFSLQSSHFVLTSPEGYLSASTAKGLLDHAEQTLASVESHLQTAAPQGKITLRLMKGWGISQVGGTHLIIWYMAKQGHVPLANSLTQILMGGGSNTVLTAGLAVQDQDRFGDFNFPDWYSTSDLGTLGVIRRGTFLPIERLDKGYDFVGPNHRVAFMESGSFVDYLIQRGGVPQFKELYASGDFPKVYGSSQGSLEQGWLQQMWLYDLLVTAVYLAVGVLCMGALSMGLSKDSKWWILVALLAPQAFGVLDLLIYFRYPSALAVAFSTLALIAMILARRVPSRWMNAGIWVLGSSVLVFYQILAMVNAYQILVAHVVS